MGGYGSGRDGVRPVAERSHALPIGLFTPTLRTMVPGDFETGPLVRWRWPSGQVAASLRYSVSCTDGGQLTIWLAYATQGRSISDPISIVTTQLHYGGKRYWWVCAECDRRVGVLYCPPGAAYWRCRHCYQITYTSSNQSHQFDRLFERVEELRRRGRR